MSGVGRACWRALACVLLLMSWSSTAAEGPLYADPTDRFGASVRKHWGVISDYDVASLHIAWYSDWWVALNPPRPNGVEYAQLVSVTEGEIAPSLAQLGPMVDANPGSLWMIGNEPECVHQGNTTPEQYAEAYHELYTFIKERDPIAQIAIGGVVQPTPLRLEWLDRVWDHYQALYGQRLPVDVWNIHNMILPEVRGGWGCEIPAGLSEDSGRLYGVDDNDNMAYFTEQIVDFRTWMRERGEQDKPLIISEYGILMPKEYGFPPERVKAFMYATFDYMLTARDPFLGYPADENRLVQRWLWYSLNDRPWDPATGAGYNGELFDYRYPQYPGVLTEHGLNFEAYTDALSGCTLQGSVTLQRPGKPAPDPSWQVPLTVTVGGAVHSATTDTWGQFTLRDLQPGTYDIRVKNPHTLVNLKSGVSLAAGIQTIHFGTLLEGDANNDNCVNIIDFSVLANGFTPRFDARADLNEDGLVNISDFSLLVLNFGRCGDIELSTARPPVAGSAD
jgi:hypothetical protein